VDAERPFDEWHWRQRRRSRRRRGRARGRRAGPPRGAGAERYEKRDTSEASRDRVTQHDVKLTAVHWVGEAVTVCRDSPAFLYSAAPRTGVGALPDGDVTTQPPETSILYRDPRSTNSPTS
jgi:hypothetical protein